jgi:hypothetical protein
MTGHPSAIWLKLSLILIFSRQRIVGSQGHIFGTGLNTGNCQQQSASDAVFLHCFNGVDGACRGIATAYVTIQQRPAQGLIKSDTIYIETPRYLVCGAAIGIPHRQPR